MMRFEDPWMLLLLLAVPLMLLYHWRYRSAASIRFSCTGVFKQLKTPRAVFFSKGLICLRCAAALLLIIALARPQSGIKSTEIITQGIDILLCLDTSGSMRALDFKDDDGKRTTRLEVVKKVVGRFIDGRKNDRTGMVVFGQEAFTQCPLTLDYGVILSLLDSVKIGMAGDSTALGSAIAICVKRLKDLESKSKVIILLTDGRSNSGDISPLTAASIAKTYKIKIYTIGVGTEGKAPFLTDSFFGKQYVYQKVDLDEGTLKKIASETGGKYFRATNTEALKDIYSKIDEMEKTKVKIKEYVEYSELFFWFLLPGLCLLLLEIILSNTRLRKIP